MDAHKKATNWANDLDCIWGCRKQNPRCTLKSNTKACRTLREKVLNIPVCRGEGNRVEATR